jgi:hypothetical protein
MNMNTNSIWVLRLAGYGAITLGLTMATAGGLLSAEYAMPYGWLFVVAVVAAEVGEAFIPVVAGIVGWSGQLIATFALCVIVSVTSIGFHLMDINAKEMLSNAKASASVSVASDEIATAQATLKALPMGLGSVADLTVLVDEANAKADQEAARGSCGKKCEAAKTEAMEARKSLGFAKSRDAAQATLNAAKTTVASTGTTESGKAALLREFAGVPVATTEGFATAFRSIATLLCLKMLTYLIIPGMKILMVANANPVKKARKARKASTAVATTEAKPAKATRKAVTTDEAFLAGVMAGTEMATVKVRKPRQVKPKITKLKRVELKLPTQADMVMIGKGRID